MSPPDKYHSRSAQADQQQSVSSPSLGHGDRDRRTWPSQRHHQATYLPQLVVSILKYLDDYLVLLLSCLARPLLSLTPSFLLRHTITSSSPEKRRPTQKIASLDGLRGVACLFVFHAHYAYSFHNWYEGVDLGMTQSKLMYQPFVTLLWSGPAMVDIFFFISGYVLVSKSLRLIRGQDMFQAFSTISSAIFRRALRLYLPSMALILTSAVMAHFGFFNAGHIYFLHAHDGGTGPSEQPPMQLKSLLAQLYDGLKDCYRLADNTIPWGKFNFAYEEEWNARPSGTVYDKHLWTIPVEFKCSMLIFVLLIATARLQAKWRLSLHTVVFLNCLFTERFSESLFVAGMIFAELDAISQESDSTRFHDIILQSPSPRGTSVFPAAFGKRPHPHSFLKHAFDICSFTYGLFLLSMPPIGANEWPTYHAVLNWVPLYISNKDGFARAIGAILATWPVATSALIAPLFTNPVSQYLGHISYALYLVHGSVIKSMWYALLPKFAKFVTRAPSISVQPLSPDGWKIELQIEDEDNRLFQLHEGSAHGDCSSWYKW
ncbi:hypothetical protein A1O3_10474 [Capronia epimyces CBS 606.96]|uniref:Acyltransferase 3 domain-containing protein n=1 Tax=Capronia epimyces CBS 606.96 TaxID=1182542 RepID=W9Y2Z9_9EURO|nr:uncharacterized protein A1O3_10474 [Capronia epimyces CBS 606.96]EXJ76829.1 hypothetical protein A1O3_10474 [Capronia epimyces CBS 606.96]